MDSYKNFPQLLRSFDYKMQPKHSDDFGTLPRPIGSLALVKHGNAEYFTEGTGFRITDGEILFIPLGGTYVSYWGVQAPELLGFHFTMANNFEKRYPVQKISAVPELFDDFNEAVSFDIINFRTIELFYNILGKIWERLASVETHIDPRIRPALDFLELTPERACTVGELARLCNMSESHFFPTFKRSVGRSPMEHRVHLLILKAQRMLETTDLSISEVSYRLGFGSETYFRRTFKAQTGISPREYRKLPLNR